MILPLLTIGMWGVKLYRNRKSVRMAAERMLNGTVHNHDYDSDQQLLKRFIWPMAKFDSVILTYFTISFDKVLIHRFKKKIGIT